MRTLKIITEYDGTEYCGWQRQSGYSSQAASRRLKTIQEVIESRLQEILQEKIRLVGSGRTDSGAHALGQVASFKTTSDLNCGQLQKALNSIMPGAIRIKAIQQTTPNFHARFSARSKHYRYTIVNNSFVSPFISRYVHLVKCPLDVKKMRQASTHLIGKHDFRSFQAADKRERNSVCTLLQVDVKKYKHFIYIDIEASGFLYKMVRNIVGTLIEVGRGRLRPEEMQRILKKKNRMYAGPCAPAKGLCLVKVAYNHK